MDFLAFIAAGLCGWQAYSYYRAAPIDIVAWSWTAAWAVAAVGAFIAGF